MHIILGIVKIESLTIELEDGIVAIVVFKCKLNFWSHNFLILIYLPQLLWRFLMMSIVMHFWWPTFVLALMIALHKHRLVGISGTYDDYETNYLQVYNLLPNDTFSIAGELPAAFKNFTSLNYLWVPFSPIHHLSLLMGFSSYYNL